MSDNLEKSPHSLINSWKEIAAFLNRGIRTVQRWEKYQGLPVHRIGNSPRAPIFAFQEELLLWLRSRENLLVLGKQRMEAGQLIAQAKLLEQEAKELRQRASRLRSKKKKKSAQPCSGVF